MSPKSSLLLCMTVLFSIVYQYQVLCSESNTTEIKTNATLPGDHPISNETESIQVHEEDEDDEEGNEEDFSIAGFFTDDSILVQPVVKPDETQKKEKTKKGDKKNKKGENDKKKRRKKKKNPCLTTHKDFCFNGECKYLERIDEVTCRCVKDYFGERCDEQYMKTQNNGDFGEVSTIALAVAAVLLSAISIIAIIIIIIVHNREKNSYEVEEKKRLGQENGSEEIDV
ncbi:amphiregulin [Spea bombifrons]|uniref:amphiregulin n=1 Tax=Spea bombifrons TaxID=233779 RepID=UPI00234A9F1F|nr:amphiregulin [Spea bombifrons]XP_053317600.1 amphiregulin [Spea bombifrons]